MRMKLRFLIAFGAAITLAQSSGAETPKWRASARWHRILKKAVPGTLLIDDDGVEFQSQKFHERWAYVDIRSFDLSAKEITLESYQRRPWHEPGERSFRFTWSEPMPPDIATLLTERVAKPVRNGVPAATSTALSEIPAHHRTWSGGSNGTLRLGDTGVDYVTENGRDSRTWRWSDIQTIANPNPYELRITGYREIAEFDLKQPISRELFETMWDHLYATGLNLSASGALSHHTAQEAHR